MKIVNWYPMAVILGLGLSGIAQASVQKFEPLIIGGTVVESTDVVAHSTVLLVGQTTVNGKSEQYVCSASIITPDTLVTAAHCVAEDLKNPVDPSNLVVAFDTSLAAFSLPFAQIAEEPSVHKISGYKFHPDWKGLGADGSVSGTEIHDIAIIRFSGDLPAGYAPAPILPNASTLQAGQTVALAGYGLASASDKAGNTVGTLRKVDVQIEQLIGSTEVLVDESHKKGSCSGDSGGPAFLKVNDTFYLWGATSRGDAKCAKAGIYTNITAYSDFIEQSETSLGSIH